MTTRSDYFHTNVRLDTSELTDDDIAAITGHPKPRYNFRPMRPVEPDSPPFNTLAPSSQLLFKDNQRKREGDE